MNKIIKKKLMGKKFIAPMKFYQLRKTDKNIQELMEWYEDKLSVMVYRQEALSNRIDFILKVVMNTITEFHSTVGFRAYTEKLKQTIKDRINRIEIKINHKI